MIKRTCFFILLMLVAKATVLSQHLSHQVLVPAAGIAVTGSVNYSQTIGETAIEIISSSGFVFTQGFQQPGIKVSSEIIKSGNGVEVYPNPASEFININLFGDAARTFRIEIISITGTVVSSGKISFITGYNYIQQFPVDKLLKGLYFVRVISEDGVISRVFKIEKI